MSTKPVGGRGLKAPYNTTIVRVPDPLLSSVKSMIDEYRELLANDKIPSKELYQDSLNKVKTGAISKNQAIDKAKQVLKLKKSARVSLEKLLQLLYDDNSINL
jgi:FMN-dependent NADH-azoreductase